MRNSSAYGSKLTKLCRKIKKESGELSAGKHENIIEEIVLGFLASEVSEAKAVSTLSKIKKHFVNYNELRVYRDSEMAKLLGTSFPNAKQISKTIIDVLQQIYDHGDVLQLQHLCEGGKREARQYFDKIKSLNGYVSARVMLLCLNAHAFPVHPLMMVMLRGEGVVDPDADEANVQGFLERHVPAKNIHEHYLMLRHYADHYVDVAAPKKTTAEKVAKKTTKKAVKKVVKETAEKKAPTQMKTVVKTKAVTKKKTTTPKQST